WKLGGIPGPETQVPVSRVALRRVCDGCFVDVDTDDVRGNACQRRRTVSLAARRIQYALVPRERPRECISMPMLVPDLADAFGRESLARELQRLALTGHDARAPDDACQRCARRTMPNSRDAPRMVTIRSIVSNTRTP